MNIPNLPVAPMVDKDGNATDVELTFRQNLITQLQNNVGNEGFVVPTQSYANMISIQNHTIPDPTVPGGVSYTCQFGTCLYVPDFPVSMVATPSIVFCVPDGSGHPLFKRVTLV